MTTANDWNNSIISEFRANEGRVGGPFKDAPMLLLHHTGAKSGKTRVNPLMYLADGDRLLIFASKGGAPSNPDWFRNLLANPAASVEVGTDKFAVEAEELTGEERDRLFAKQAGLYPQFGQYQANTSRTIPVVALKRKS
jgi:deazaflavin-dependent oxidoreductase (nitroreductase family)